MTARVAIVTGAASGIGLAVSQVLADKGPGNENRTIYRTPEGVERFMITDIDNPAGSAMAQSDLAIMWDHWSFPEEVFSTIASYNHVPGGSNVLYMDGHVEFIRQGTAYPVPYAMGPGDGSWPIDTAEGASWHMGQIQAAMGGNYNP